MCQDVSHSTLSLLRAVGIPSRYVSGYIHTEDAEIGVTGLGESHAWVEIRNGAWEADDPTNGRIVGPGHVLVARGRDYADVSPLTGIYAGPLSQDPEVVVEATRLARLPGPCPTVASGQAVATDQQGAHVRQPVPDVRSGGVLGAGPRSIGAVDRAEMANRALRLRGWKIVGDPPPDPVVVMIGAPHTSNWDFPFMLLLTWAKGVDPHFLMKKEAFRGPAGALFRRLGGVAVDRDNPAGLVEELVARASAADRLEIVIAPEGTRKQKKYWKAGFYRIAKQAGIPICLAWIDGPSKTMGYGPTIRPSDDVRADMDILRAFYADKRGLVPERKTEPRLREEDAPR